MRRNLTIGLLAAGMTAYIVVNLMRREGTKGKIKIWNRDVIVEILAFFNPSELVKMQLVCRHWYERRVPEQLVIRTDIGRMRQRLQEMLDTVPDTPTHPAAKDLWLKVGPLDVKSFELCW